MGGMFLSCTSLKSIDVSNFNTAKVTGMNYMFYGCSSLQSLDISNFNTKNVTSMNHMFDDCRELKAIYASDKFTTDKVPSSDELFNHCFLSQATLRMTVKL